MRHFIATILRRLLNVAGLYDIRGTLAAIQAQQVEILNSIRRLDRQPQPNRGQFDQILNRLYAASLRCRSIVRGNGVADRNASGLADYYATLAGLVSHHWSGQLPPPDKFPDDDLSLDYARRHGAPAANEEAVASEQLPHYTWQHFFSIHDSGVFLVLAQAGNPAAGLRDATGEVFSFDYRTMRCHRATGQLPGLTTLGPWAQLGDMLIEQNVFNSVLLVPIDISAAGASAQDQLGLALRRIQNELGSRLIPFSAVIWQQGASDAGQGSAYNAHQLDLIAALRELGVFAPVMFEQHTNVDAARGVFAGPSNAQASAAEWAETIKSQRDLLGKL